MGKKVQNPCKHIASCRLNEEEWKLLAQLSVMVGKSKSDILRSAFKLLTNSSIYKVPTELFHQIEGS